MKNKLVKYFALSFTILASMTLFNSCFNQKNSNNNNSDFSEGTSNMPNISYTDISYNTPESDVVYEDTGNYLFKNNKSDYSIVIPEQAMEKELLAKDELVDFFKRSTGHL